MYVFVHVYMIIEKSGYILAETNKLCKENEVENLEKCRSAVSEIKNVVPNAFFRKTEVDERYPKGCYLYVPKGAVYFNEHGTGSKNRKARQICKLQD